MKSLIVAMALLGAGSAGAIENSELLGRWKMTSYQCASGKAINAGADDIASVKFDVGVNFLSADRAEAKIDYSIAFKSDYVKKTRKELADQLAKLKAEPASPSVASSIAEFNRIIAEFDKNVEPRTCSNINRMNYYLRGNVFYTNDLNNLSTCTDASDDGTDNFFELESSTIDIKGKQLVITGGREVETNSTCPINDRSVMTFVRE